MHRPYLLQPRFFEIHCMSCDHLPARLTRVMRNQTALPYTLQRDLLSLHQHDEFPVLAPICPIELPAPHEDRPR